MRLLDSLLDEASQLGRYRSRGLLWRALKCKVLSRAGLPRLETIFICPSHECNARCWHCYEKFQHEAFGHSLTTQEVKDVVDQFWDLGGCRVVFCSGEFLLRPDALDLVGYAGSKGMFVSVTSNGLLLDEEKVEALRRAGLAELVVSIDSADPARHDELRGVPGCFKAAVEGLRIARRKGIITQLWTYVTRSRMDPDDLEGIARLGLDLGVERVYVYFTLLSGHLFDKPEENLSFEEREAYRAKFNGRKALRLEFPEERIPCNGGGSRHMAVMPTGDATFCPPVPYSYGNIRSRPLRDCLRDMLADYRRFPRCTGQCPVNFQEYRKGCRARFMYDRS